MTSYGKRKRLNIASAAILFVLFICRYPILFILNRNRRSFGISRSDSDITGNDDTTTIVEDTDAITFFDFQQTNIAFRIRPVVGRKRIFLSNIVPSQYAPIETEVTCSFKPNFLLSAAARSLAKSAFMG